MSREPRRHLVSWVIVVVLAALVLGISAPGAIDAAITEVLRRNDVGPGELDRPIPGQPVSFLVVGSDRREEMPPEIEALGPLTGEKADVVMVWLVDARARTISVVSLSRYLRVRLPGHGTQMLSGALDYGATAVVEATRSLVDVPIHHYVELDFAAVRNLVDTADGITLAIPKPARDLVTHLDLPAGEQRLDGDQALAYLRSRHYEELRDGQWTRAKTGDDGRIARQHRVIQALLGRIAELDNPVKLAHLLLAVARHVTVDQTLRAGELAELREILADNVRLRAANLPTQLDVPAQEADSPFPPRHVGTIGFRLLSEPAATRLLRELSVDASIVKEDGG
jgi:polyisoprenyl-teichoic acid--peptidoglycan teichoic acid transferase